MLLPRVRRPRLTGRVLPLLVGALTIAAGVRWGVDGVLRVAGVGALVLLGSGVHALGSFARALRGRLDELEHLPDLGRGFVSEDDDGLVSEVTRTSSGDLVLEVVSDSHRTVVLDDAGSPDHVTPVTGSRRRWAITGSRDLDAVQVDRIQALLSDAVPVQVTSRGVIDLTGPVPRSWRLRAANGLVIESRA